MHNNLGLVPNYITAKTPQGLRRKMIALISNLRQELHFYEIYSYSNDENSSVIHIAWYYTKLDLKRESMESDEV